MPLSEIVSRPLRRYHSASLSAPRTNPDGASNRLLRGCGILPASVNGIAVLALDVSGLHQRAPCLGAVALHQTRASIPA
jgi:hypothetical protein